MDKNIRLFVLLFTCFFTASGYGLADDRAKITVRPIPKQISFRNNGECQLTKFWQIVDSSQNETVSEPAGYLRQQLSKRYGFSLPLIKTLRPEAVKNSVVMGTLQDVFIRDIVEKEKIDISRLVVPGGYLIEIFENYILIAGVDPEGAFYGLQSFLQLIKSDGEVIRVPQVSVIDYPAIKLRGIHVFSTDPHNIKSLLDLMAELRINLAIFQTGRYFQLEKDNNRQALSEIFAYARERFIEPVPELTSFGVGIDVLRIDPRAAEGIWIRDEHFRFINDEAVPVKTNRKALVNVIRSADSDIVVTSLNKEKTYREGVDYKVVDGRMAYPYAVDNQPFRIIRMPAGAIKQSEEILVSYDYVERKYPYAEWSIPYCPSSELTYQIMFKVLTEVISLLRPKYVSIAHDEVRGLNRDSRCRKRNLTNAELFADEINRLDIFAKTQKSDLKLMMWDDMLNPWHGGGEENGQVSWGGVPGKTTPAIDMVAKDIIMLLWWYDEDDWMKKMQNSPDYYRAKQFKYFVCGYKNEKNIDYWVKIARNRNECYGLLITTWDGWEKNIDAIKYMAEKAWEGDER